MSLFTRLKAAARMIFSTANPWYFMVNTRRNYQTKVGDLTKSSVVMAPLQFIMKTLPEAKMAVRIDDELIHNHDFVRLMKRPNPYYSGTTLMMAIGLSFNVDGNVYLIKIRNGQLKPIQLWYVPHWLMEPKYNQNGKSYIDYYEYTPGTERIKLDPKDVIHLRNGLDPFDIRKGLAPLKTLYREVYTDEEAANFAASILANGGVPGIMISPDSDTTISFDEDIKDVKDFFKSGFTGDKRGEPLVMRGPTRVEQFGFNPQQLDLSKLRQIPEERVTACLNLPAAVVGFGTGLEQTKVGATMKELREQAYESCIIPMQRIIAEDLTMQLLYEFETDEDAEVEFDTSDIRVLQEDQNKLAERVTNLANKGLITVGEGRAELGYEVKPEHDVYLRPISLTEIPAGETVEDRRAHAEEMARRIADGQGGDEGDEDNGPNGKGEEEKVRSLMVKALNDAQVRLNEQLAKQWDHYAGIWALELIQGFRKMAKVARAAYEEWIREHGVEQLSETTPELKINEDEMYEFITQSTDPDSYLNFDRQYLRVGSATYKLIEMVMGLTVVFDAQAEASILAAAGTRKGLVDMSQQMKDSLFATIREAREQGIGPMQAAALFEDKISAGPWKTAETRANVISRSETKYAQNKSSIDAYGSAGVKEVQVIDAQLGETDEECMSLDGTIVDILEADALAASEHPNGTRSFVPVVRGRIT